jgi:hypothetical protein
MKQSFTKSILASIEAQRDAVHCESVVRYYPVVERVLVEEHHYPSGGFGVRLALFLRKVSDNTLAEIDAKDVLCPKDDELITSYLDRLTDHLNYLDDHALFVEIPSEMFS